MSTVAEPQGLINTPGVAKILGVNLDKVRGFIEAGELRAINIVQDASRRPIWRVRPADLEDFLNRRATKPKPRPKKSGKRASVRDIQFK